MSELEEHIARMRVVNQDFDIPEIDVWDPATIDALRDLTCRKGRITGTFGPWKVQYFEGRYLPVEVNLLDRTTGRRIAQDGSEDLSIWHRLKARL